MQEMHRQRPERRRPHRILSRAECGDDFVGGGIGDIEECGRGRPAPGSVDVVENVNGGGGRGTAHEILRA